MERFVTHRAVGFSQAKPIGSYHAKRHLMCTLSRALPAGISLPCIAFGLRLVSGPAHAGFASVGGHISARVGDTQCVARRRSMAGRSSFTKWSIYYTRQPLSM